MLDLSSVALSADTIEAERELLRLTNREVRVIRADAIGEMSIYLGDDAYEITATFNCEAAKHPSWKWVWLFTPIDDTKIVAALIRAKDNGDLMYWTTYR